ncbi:MAG: hypothetical protein VB093_06140 [Propionicimonas sp.]|nr:hypothetical protein [Propionicimonas sp.]
MATVDDLLRRLHRQAAGLRLTGDPARQLQAHLRGWMPLATNAGRLLDALDPRPEDRELYGLLQTLSHGRNIQPGRIAVDLDALALTVGALGDVVISSPRDVAQAGQNQRSRLQASVQAAVHAAARATVDIARAAGQSPDAETVRKVAEATELAALLPPLARVSALERLTVTRLTPDTADGAVQLWAGVAQHTFTNYQLVTGIALQDAAATLALLCQTTAETLRQAARRHILDPDDARATARLLSDASAAWHKAAVWPPSVQLGGRAYEHQQAVKAVRDALAGPPVARLTLRERVQALRAAVTAAVTIGGLQSTAVARVANQGGLWVAHERENLRPPGVQRKRIKLDWEHMPWGHPAGRLLVDQARTAHTALTAAVAAVNQAVLPAVSLSGEAGHITLVDHRIVADWWETVEPPARTRRPEDEAAAKRRPSVDRAIGR